MKSGAARNSEGTLVGRRVVVTRAAEQAGPLAAQLRAAGAEVLGVPTVSIQPAIDDAAIAAAVGRLGPRDWLALTSANAVRVGLGGVRAVACRTAAVGPATAAALRERGWPAPWLPTRPNASALADELPVRPGDRVLLLRSDLADQSLPNALSARGAIVDDVAAYRTVPRTEPAPELAAPFDTVVLMSPSAVDGLLNAVGGDATRLADKLLVAAGPTTAAHLARKGLRAVEAAGPTPEAILDALAAVPA